MNIPIPECPACRVNMEEGHVLESAASGKLERTRWTEGAPEKRLGGGCKVKGKRQFDTVAYRCPRCGWLLWFAPETSE